MDIEEMRILSVHLLSAPGQPLLVLVLCLCYLCSDGREVVDGEVRVWLAPNLSRVNERHFR